MERSPELEASPIAAVPKLKTGTTTTKKEQRSANTLYQELSFQDNEESEENEVTGELIIFVIVLLVGYGSGC